MRLTWYGQSAFRLDTEGPKVLFDPFLTGNPLFRGDRDAAVAGVTHCVITHGHRDHTGDVLDVARLAGPHVFSNYEVIQWLQGKGIAGPERLQGMNTGGTVSIDGASVTLVRADHSSSQENVPLGSANGAVVRIGERAVWHLGDTDIFSDMALICEIHRPDVALVPVGDRFTMGPEVAALAVKRFMPGVRTVIPCHYATYPLLLPDADRFVAALKGHDVRVIVPAVGESVTI